MNDAITEDQVISVFARVLGVPAESVNDDLRYNTIPSGIRSRTCPW